MKILEERDIFKPGSLNIFVDASIHKYNKHGYLETLGCPGLVAVDVLSPKFVVCQHSIILRHATNNSSEIMAIYLGVEYALSQRNNYDTINIFSDSKICVYGLREWIFNWYNNKSTDYKLYGSSGVVANQETFKKIIQLISNNNLKINLYHQKGHVVLNSVKSLDNARRVFEVSNGLQIQDNNFMNLLSTYNDLVDVNTKNHLKSFIGEDLTHINQPLLNPFIIGLKESEVSNYKNYINIGGK